MAFVVVAVPLLVLALFVQHWAAWAALGVTVVVHIWLAWLARRRVRAIGYAEREDDLLIRRGIMFRSMVVVPYGRMQYVDVTAGPLARAFRVATVELHTAAAFTDATIPGLDPAEAARLRDRLASRGEASLAGL
ncbi:MAG: hypothetical protein CSA58_09815 [Micrococcales bacterium]|nr:MAG: hypothetical protein CSA58_09815 [Micrococcales bacterium]